MNRFSHSKTIPESESSPLLMSRNSSQRCVASKSDKSDALKINKNISKLYAIKRQKQDISKIVGERREGGGERETEILNE